MWCKCNNESNILYHKCLENINVSQPIQGGRVILEAIMANQKTSDPSGNTNTIIFGLAGSSTFQWNSILQEAIDYLPNTPADNFKKLKMIHITNECAGTYAAQNFSNNMKVGVVFTTRGPGITMALTGIVSAMREELPLVYICGVSPTDIKDEFQNVDLTILDKVAKRTYRITSSNNCIQHVHNIITNACHVAIAGTNKNPGKGPVVIMVDFDFWRKSLNTKCNMCWIPHRVLTGNEKPAIREIIKKWNTITNQSIIVMRIGTRCSPEIARKMVKLSDYFPQLYIVATFDARGMIDPDPSKTNNKYLDVHGPVGNRAANNAVNYALANGLVIDAGVGVLYTTLSVDVVGNVIRLFDEPIEKDGYMVNVNYVLDKLYGLVFQVDQGKLYKNMSYIYNNFGNATTQFKLIYDEYVRQGPGAYYYPGVNGPTIEIPISHVLPSIGHIVARCMKNFYDNDTTSLVINSNDYYHVYDSGTAAFIAGQLGRMKYSNNDGVYTEYSAIGLSLASAAGKIWGNPKHVVVYIGDGAFMNMLGSIIDLKQAAHMNNKKALILYFNDYRYGNVALGDLALPPNTYTSIPITVDLLNQFDVNALMISVCGAPKFCHAFNDTDIDIFITLFKNTSDTGLYILRMDGETTRIARSATTTITTYPCDPVTITTGDYPRDIYSGLPVI